MFIKRLLALYPPLWRQRYEEEMLALLEQHCVTWRTVLDLVCGALEARQDPYFRTFTATETAHRIRRAYHAIFWGFPLLIAGYMYFLDSLDDALYSWNQMHTGLLQFKLASEIALAIALFAFLLTALLLTFFLARQALTRNASRARLSERTFRLTLPALVVIVLGMVLHILYTAVWGYTIWNLPASTVQAMARAANRTVWSGNGWHVQIIGGVLWMGLLTSYLLRCVWQSFDSMRNTARPEGELA